MPIRDIVIDASPKEGIEQLFSWVDRFNERLQARLSCVSYAWPKSDLEEALLNPLGTAGLERRMEMEIASVRDTGTKILESPDTSWCTGIAQPDDAILDHLHTADMLVSIAGSSRQCVTPDPIDLAVRSGTPVLRLKSGITAAPIGVAVVAWKDGAAARHALHASRALLALANEIQVVGVGDEVTMRRLDEVVDFLGRSGLPAKAIHLPDPKGRPGEVIIDHALASGADIVISGARSERTLRDRLFGNATRQFTQCSELSWYMTG